MFIKFVMSNVSEYTCGIKLAYKKGIISGIYNSASSTHIRVDTV